MLTTQIPAAELAVGMVVEVPPDLTGATKQKVITGVYNSIHYPSTIYGIDVTNGSYWSSHIPPNTPHKVLRSTKRILVGLRDVDVDPLALYMPNLDGLHGSDPEIFAVRKSGEIIPAWEYLPGKKKPLAFPDGTAYYDGFQAEFTVDPCGCHGFLTDRVREGLRAVWEAAKMVDPDATLSIASALPVGRDTLMTTDPDHVALGCSPSRNAYGEGKLSVADPYELQWRFAGSHLHYGYDGITEQNVIPTVQMLDAVAGVMNVAMGGEFGCRERRRWYGHAGEFRFHLRNPNIPYHLTGYYNLNTNRLEWRVPDTTILSHPVTYNFFIDISRQVMKMGVLGFGFLWQATEEETRTAINEYDVVLARKILERNRRMVNTIIQRVYGKNSSEPLVTYAWRLLNGGLGEVVKDPTDVVRNWSLDNDWLKEGVRSPLYRTAATNAVGKL